jgi:uncharacterized phage-associated protein
MKASRDTSGDRRSEAIAKSLGKLLKVVGIMAKETYTASQIANFFLAITDPDENDMSNLKIQKLCYYAQGLCSAMRGRPLFSETIEAWDHGPVVPALYHEFKVHKSEPIPIPEWFDFSTISDPDRTALTDLYEYYAQFSAWRLRDMTHEERPWKDAYKRPSKEITIEALVEFFGQQVDGEYREKIYS